MCVAAGLGCGRITLVKGQAGNQIDSETGARPVIICGNIARVMALNWATHWWLLRLY
jgi:hypothetical protein